MYTTKGLRSFSLTVLLTLIAFATAIRGQQTPTKTTPGQDVDVLRIKTELVQTDLMVFDKQGRFVEGLKPEQFELTLDGKKQPITFFELVSSGSASEAAKIAAARNPSATPAENARPEGNAATDRGRTIFFYLDDVHLSEASVMRARRALVEFVENQMNQNDQVAIVSSSGQIGFLQQLTDYKPTLRAAIDRITYKRNPETYAGKVPISDYQATRVVDHNDRDLFVYLLTATINEYQSKGPLMRVAANMVKNRVRQISMQSKSVTNDVLAVLGSLMQSSASLPGRKLVFFISDGFITDVRGSNAMGLLKHVTDLAAQSGVVVYTMDARGTMHDSNVDAGRNDFPDGMATGTQAVQPSLENAATQEPLHILADDTGGRAILDSNSYPEAFQQAINETSTYYLLAWRPETDEQRSGKSRIRVTVKDRPELRVRLRRNYYAASAAAKQDEKKTDADISDEKVPEIGLLTALGALYPQRTIPTAVSAGYVSTADQGLLLKAAMQIDRTALDLSARDSPKSELDVIGAAVDDRGIIVTFKQLLTVTVDPSLQNQLQPVVWSQQLKLQPGLYQVRVAVRERSTGRTGSAQQWIEVPDLSRQGMQLSSLFLGERNSIGPDERLATAPRPVMVDVDHRFSRASVLRFQTFVYNAAGNSTPPDVMIQARVFRDNRAVVTMAAAKVPTDTTRDLMRLPYWAEVPLNQLPPGRYSLQVTATDRSSRTTVTQRAGFVVE